MTKYVCKDLPGRTWDGATLHRLEADGRLMKDRITIDEVERIIRSRMGRGDTYQEGRGGVNTYESMAADWRKHDAAVERDRVRFGVR